MSTVVEEVGGVEKHRWFAERSLLALLLQQHLLDVGQHSAGSDGDPAEQLVELLVIANGELKEKKFLLHVG